MNHLTWIALSIVSLAACTAKDAEAPGAEDTDTSGETGSSPPDVTASNTSDSPSALPSEPPPAGEPHVTSFSNVDDAGNILGVGVLIPVSFFETVPSDEPAFQGSVGVEMPADVRDKTFVQLLRINWLAGGHGPEPYHAPHFDLHFYRGSKAEVSAISCPDPEPFAAELLASGYETPSTCVAGMGYHAWPSADVAGGEFSASIILGYAAQRMVFIEPMVTQELLVSRQDFERDIVRPVSAGGASTLYPAHFSAKYSAADDSYRLEFSQFQSID
jgi:hypothetical protein